MWYELKATDANGNVLVDSNGNPMFYSFGFNPVEGTLDFGRGIAEGLLSNRDHIDYPNPPFSSSMWITETQFNLLRDFGLKPSEFGFDTTNWTLNNNCIDFVWSALDAANLNRGNIEAEIGPWGNRERIDLIFG